MIARALLAACLPCLAWPALAQRPTGRQLELRADLIAARTTSAQVGVGVNVPAGLYVRVGATAAVGAAHRFGELRTAARGDLVARFLFDPFREVPLGLYGMGGVSAMYDPFERWRPRVVVGMGVEGRVRGRRVLAGEIALGGGVRASLVVRRARTSGR